MFRVATRKWCSGGDKNCNHQLFLIALSGIFSDARSNITGSTPAPLLIRIRALIPFVKESEEHQDQ